MAQTSETSRAERESGVEEMLRELAAAMERSLESDGERILRLYFVRPAGAARGVLAVDRAVDTAAWQERVRRDLPGFRAYDLSEQFFAGAHRECWELVRFDKATKTRTRVQETVRTFRKRDTKTSLLGTDSALVGKENGLPPMLLESWVPEEHEFPNFENIPLQRRSVLQFRYPRGGLVGVDINFLRSGKTQECFLQARYNQFSKEKVLAALQQALSRFFLQ